MFTTEKLKQGTKTNPPDASIELRLNPFLHHGDTQIYNPLTDRSLRYGESHYQALRQFADGQSPAEPVLSELFEQDWLVREGEDQSKRFYLKYVSLEAHTVCNQACYFCPVSIAPRESHFMPMDQYQEILNQLQEWRETIEAIFMISYNEPTADARFVDQVRRIRQAGFPPATLTNGTGLTPARVDELVDLGGLRFLSINLSTIDPNRYEKERGGDHLDLVLKNLDYMKNRAVGEDMDIVVLGVGDQVHRDDFAAIRSRFEGSRFNVKYFVVNDRASYLEIGLKAHDIGENLKGCEHMGSRPLQHLHITPLGKVILCCQDYREDTEVGDLSRSTVKEVLMGEPLAKMRRMIYGLEKAQENFICRYCKFALRQ